MFSEDQDRKIALMTAINKDGDKYIFGLEEKERLFSLFKIENLLI